MTRVLYPAGASAGNVDACALPILRSSGGKPQLKRYERLPSGVIASTGIARETYWRSSCIEVTGINDLARELKRLADDPTAIVIRDEPKTDVDITSPIRRRAAFFDDVPRRWAMIDVDDLVAPHLDVVDEPELAAHFVRDELATYAPELEGVAMFIAWSGSCGIRDRTTIKAHAWVMLDQARSGAELKRWARAVNARWKAAGSRKTLIDDSIFDRVHIYYSARPSCVGFPDPFPGERRFTMLRGEPVAALVVPGMNAPRTSRKGDCNAPIANTRGFEARLALIGVDGINNEAMAAIGSAVRDLGADRAEASRSMILSEIEARIRGKRDPARAAEHIAKLDGMFDRIVAKQRLHDADAMQAEPTYPDMSVPLEEAESAAKAEIGGFFSRISEGADAPVVAISSSTGVGKTKMVLDGVAPVQPQYRGAILLPRHKLTDETLTRAQAHKITAASWRGRQARNPDATDGSAMCIEPAIYAAAKRADAVEAACSVCPSREVCPYLAQRSRAPAALEVAANNFLALRPPAAIVETSENATRTVDYLVIDEAFMDRMVDAPRVLLLDALTAMPAGIGPSRRADLDAKRAPVRRALRAAMEDGKLLLRHLHSEGIDAVYCEEWEAAEWLARPKIELTGGSAEELVSQLRAIEGRFDTRPAWLARAIKQYLNADDAEYGHAISLAIRKVTGPAQYRSPEAGAIELRQADPVADTAATVRFRVRRDLHCAWEGVPALIVDAATLPSDKTLSRIFGRVVKRVEVIARMPEAVRVTQIVDPLPKSALVDEAGRAKEKLRDVADRIEILARRWSGQGADGCDLLVVATIAVETGLHELLAGRGIDVAPPGSPDRLHAVELRHYGDLAGEDRYRGVRAIMLVSWPLPPAAPLERDVGAAVGLMPRRLLDGAWAMADAALRMRDGTGRRVMRPVHPDPEVEGLRWRRTEGEMLQALGRARWSRRTEASPLDVLILSPLPLPEVVVDHTLRWADIAPSRLELAFWRLGGVLPLRPDDLVRTGLWSTSKAADRELEGAGIRKDPPSPLIKGFLKATGGLRRFEYRRPGQRAWSTALADVSLPPTSVVDMLRTATCEPELIVEARPVG